jgi:hypothetical protein
VIIIGHRSADRFILVIILLERFIDRRRSSFTGRSASAL